MSYILKKIAILLLISPAISADLTGTLNPQFMTFIGMPKHFQINGISGVAALVEANYDKKADETSIIHISPALSPVQEAPLQVQITYGTAPDPLGGEMEENYYNFTTSSGVNALTITNIHYASCYTTPIIFQYSGTVDNVQKAIYGYIDQHKNDNKALIACQQQDDEALLKSENPQIQKLANYLQTLKIHETLSQKNYTLLKEKETELVAHANDVIKTFQYIAPKASVKLYHPNDFAILSQDQDISVISVSAGIADHTSGHFDFSKYDKFTRSNKIVVIGLPNNHTHLTPDTPLVKFLKEIEGYHVIVCSTSTYLSDSQLGNVGDFLVMEDQNNPDLQIVFDSYMTAPGVGLDFIKPDDVLNGCSFSAPIVAATILHLKHLYPNATNAQLKKAIVQGGRKRPLTTSQIQPNDKYHNHLDFSGARNILESSTK